MKLINITLLFPLAVSTDAYNIVASRRQILAKSAFSAAAAFSPVAATHAMDACPPKSNNCIRTVWTPPEGTSKVKLVNTIKEAINSYPQEGQNKVDLGGWTIVEDNLTSSGTARVEYRSGIGNFAKFLNGGKPFVDDLKLEITDSGSVQVRSSSRVGDSDFDVNRKRLVFLADKLRGAGWTVPDPKY